MIYQDVHKKAMQAYIKYKALYDKKANASELQEADYVYVLQPKADNQGSKIRLRNFGGLALTLLRRCYLTTTTWYANLAPTKRKCLSHANALVSAPPTPS